MKRGLGIARCGLACCLCAQNAACAGCDRCADRDWCENRRCSLERGLEGCYACDELGCRKGLLQKSKPYGFIQFIRRYGVPALLRALEENEKRGGVYHRSGITGDYDDFEDPER